MTDLLDDIMSEAPPARVRCHVARTFAHLDTADAADFTRALGAYGVTAVQISRAMRKRGHDLGESSVARHRRGACNCGRA